MFSKKSMPLVLLTLLFVVPMLAAWLAFSKGYFLKGTVNRGELIQPSIPIATLNITDTNGVNQTKMFKGKWWLVYVTKDLNDQKTQQNLYYMRQIRQATGKERTRVQRAIITLDSNPNFDNWLTKNFDGTLHFIISDAKFTQLESETIAEKLALPKAWLYLVDPLGNIMMVYAPDTKPKGILKDLQRVLKVSQIG